MKIHEKTKTMRDSTEICWCDKHRAQFYFILFKCTGKKEHITIFKKLAKIPYKSMLKMIHENQ